MNPLISPCLNGCSQTDRYREHVYREHVRPGKKGCTFHSDVQPVSKARTHAADLVILPYNEDRCINRGGNNG
jgi:hypothetical protein